MIKPTIPTNEVERLIALEEYNILDTLPELEFDDITKIASQICQTPISLVSLIDDKRQWFKSHHGLGASETPKDVAFCAHAINEKDQVFIVPDSRIDERFSDNPLVTGDPRVIFYTGVPLVSPDGYALGTLCVIDHEPKVLSPDQLDSLKALANQVIRLFELRKKNLELKKLHQKLTNRNSDLEKFAYVVSHDLKSPLATIISFTQLLSIDHKEQLDKEGAEIVDYIKDSAGQLKNFIDGIIDFYRGDQFKTEAYEELNFTDFVQTVVNMLTIPKQNCRLIFPPEPIFIKAPKTSLKQIYLNLVSNAIKYNDKEVIEIGFTLSEDDHFYHFTVSDNGVGIDAANQNKIFDLFKHLDTKDRFGNYGTGIGLATVKKVIERNGGSIQLQSEKNQGTTFLFSLKKE